MTEGFAPKSRRLSSAWFAIYELKRFLGALDSFKRPKLVFSDDGNHAVIMDVEATDSGLALRMP